MLSYIFMGTPPLAATILEKLCEAYQPPVAVVTQLAKAQGRGKKVVPTAVEYLASRRGLSVLTTLDVNLPATVEALRTFTPDLILVAAFGQLLKNDILTMPKLFCLNVHASLLPQYRGASPVQRAIWNGDTLTGVTLQKMERKLDTGDILLQGKCPIAGDDTSETLMARLAALGADLLLESVRAIDRNHYTFVKQDDALATYAPKIEKEDAVIRWTEPARKIECMVRALQPWPVAESKLGRDRVKIFKAAPAGEGAGAPGSLRTDGKSFLHVTCGDGQALSALELQFENRKRLDVRSFLLGYRGNFPFSEMTT